MVSFIQFSYFFPELRFLNHQKLFCNFGVILPRNLSFYSNFYVCIYQFSLHYFRKCQFFLYYDLMLWIYWRLGLNNFIDVSTILTEKFTIFINLRSIMQEGNMKIRQMTPYFQLPFQLYLVATLVFIFENSQT